MAYNHLTLSNHLLPGKPIQSCHAQEDAFRMLLSDICSTIPPMRAEFCSWEADLTFPINMLSKISSENFQRTSLTNHFLLLSKHFLRIAKTQNFPETVCSTFQCCPDGFLRVAELEGYGTILLSWGTLWEKMVSVWQLHLLLWKIIIFKNKNSPLHQQDGSQENVLNPKPT